MKTDNVNSSNGKGNAASNATRKVIRSTVQGRSFLTFDFFRRNIGYVIIGTLMILMFISNKFMCQSYMREVMALKVDLDNAKTDCVNATARYNSMIRESQMKKVVDTLHIDLDAPEQPPYHLTNK